VEAGITFGGCPNCCGHGLGRVWEQLNDGAQQSMKNQLGASFLAAGLILGSISSGQAMSFLVSMGATPMWPTNPLPSGTVLYELTTVGRGGAGLLEVTLSAGALPPGVSVTFSPSVLRFTGVALSTQISTMIVTCSGLIPLDCYPFTITGTTQKGESITITNQVTYSPSYVATRPATLFVDNNKTSVGLPVRGLGACGGSYLIQTTTNLATPVWSTLGTSTADGNGRFIWFTGQTNLPMQFYRSVVINEPMAGQ